MKEEFEKILERLEREIAGKPTPDEYNNGINRAYSIVQEVAEEFATDTNVGTNGWIACSVRLPEKNGMYLCTQNSYDLATNKNIIRVSTELVEFYNGKWRRAKNLVITHWHPLPEPYKERD